MSDTSWLDQYSRVKPGAGAAAPAPMGAPLQAMPGAPAPGAEMQPQQGGADTAWLDAVSRPVGGSHMPGATPFRQEPLTQGTGETVSSGEALRRVAGSVGDWVTGEGKMDYPDMPDIMEVLKQTTTMSPAGALGFSSRVGEAGGGENALRMGLMAASDPAQVVDIALANLPGSTASQDSQGNPIINWQGSSWYAWKPGFRQQDLVRLGAQTVPYGAASRAAVQATGGLLSRVAGLLGLNAATSGALDVAAGAAGSEQGVSVPRAIMAGVGGAAGEELLRPMGNVALRSAGRESVLDATGNVTPEVSDQLRREGIDPSTFTQEQTQSFADTMKRTIDPAAAGVYTEASTLPRKIPLTKGQLTRDPEEQMFEDAVRKGTYGRRAQQMSEDFRMQRDDAIRGNARLIQENLGGGQVLEKGQAGEMVQENLLEQQRRAGELVGARYKTAEAADAIIAGEGIDSLAGRIAADAGVRVRKNKLARGFLADLRKKSDNGLVTVESMADWRREVTEMRASPKNAAEAGALSKLVDAFDKNVESIVNEFLRAGDENAAKLWARAVGSRRKMGKRFQGRSKLIDDLVKRQSGDQRGQLKVSPRAASNQIFGRANLGFGSKPEIADELNVLRRTLGKSSDAWQALREEAFMRFAINLEGAQSGGAVGVSGAKAKSGWENARRSAAPVIRELFSPEEVNLITQFFSVAERATNPMPGGANYSNTTPALASLFKRINDNVFVGPSGVAWLSRVFPNVHEYLQNNVMSQRFRTNVSGAEGALPPREVVPQGFAGGVGAATIGPAGGNYLSPDRRQYP